MLSPQGAPAIRYCHCTLERETAAVTNFCHFNHTTRLLQRHAPQRCNPTATRKRSCRMNLSILHATVALRTPIKVMMQRFRHQIPSLCNNLPCYVARMPADGASPQRRRTKEETQNNIAASSLRKQTQHSIDDVFEVVSHSPAFAVEGK